MEMRLPADLERGRGERGADAGPGATAGAEEAGATGAWGSTALALIAPLREEPGTKGGACGLSRRELRERRRGASRTSEEGKGESTGAAAATDPKEFFST